MFPTIDITLLPTGTITTRSMNSVGVVVERRDGIYNCMWNAIAWSVDIGSKQKYINIIILNSDGDY